MDNKLISTYRWPKGFPTEIFDKCGVIAAEGRVYRLVRTTPPTKVDFQPHRVEKPNYKYAPKDIHKSYGISFWSKLSKIQRIAKNYPFPEQYGDWHTVYGNLTADLGVIPEEMTPDGHVTLWASEGAEPHKHIKHEVEE